MSNRQQREQALQNALDSFALEFLQPSAENLQQMEDWLNGKVSPQQLMDSAYEIWQQRSLL